GDLHTVKDISGKGEIILDNGHALDRNYRYFTYGYAQTSHSAQSRTVDWLLPCQSALISSPASDAAQFYNCIARGHERPHLFLDELEAAQECASRIRTRELASELIHERDLQEHSSDHKKSHQQEMIKVL